MQDYTQDKVLVSSRAAQLVGRTCSGGVTQPGVHLLPQQVQQQHMHVQPE